MVSFTLAGAPYQILTHPTDKPLTDATSISVLTDDQPETDRLWAALTEGGTPLQCGWLHRWGVAWQIVPRRLMELQAAPDTARAERVRQAMYKMVKIDIAALEAAANEH